jgi:hypothetical protein
MPDHDMPDALHEGSARSRLADTYRPLDAATIAQEVSEMRRWAEETKVDMPIPLDLLLLMAKDGVKPMEIVLNNMSLGDGVRRD